MKAKEYLMQLKGTDELLKSLRDELDTAEWMLGAQSSKYSDTPSFSKGNASDHTAVDAINIAALKQEISLQIERYVELKLTAIKIINEMEDVRYKTVLYNYYVQNRTLTGTAAQMNRSYQNVCALHSAALNAFQKLMDLHGIGEKKNGDEGGTGDG